MQKIEEKKIKGITLIALVITIIVLLILAGVTIASLGGENGILSKAVEAREKTKEQQKEEEEIIKDLEYYVSNIEEGSTFNPKTKVNEPQIATGMTKIMFDASNKVIKDGESGFDKDNWYNYTDKKWANIETEDGSMWVWIPRFAYKINDNKTVDVKFLIGTSDDYYEKDGIKTAKRQKEVGEKIDTKVGYTVHPAFTNEANIGFANGGWDKELSGIWVAKFEAGYADKNNFKASNVNYSQTKVWAHAVETGDKDGNLPARNWLDGEYGSKTTSIKYPVFKGSTYSMNYINHNDAFNISKALTDVSNPYGLSKTTDSHLMKNSEWGAVAYLGKSQYGLGSTAIALNNKNLNNTPTSVYAVSGYDDASKQWNEVEGTKKSSSSGTVYGVFDMAGGTWERTAAYINNPVGQENRNNYGKSITKTGEVSTKYTTVYPFDSNADKAGVSDYDLTGEANHAKNTLIYGDTVRETSTLGKGAASWDGDYSYFPALDSPFFVRGGACHSGSNAGLLAFYRSNGNSHWHNGFRSVLVIF